MDKHFYKVAEVAQILCISKSFVYNEVAKKHIPCVKIGNRILIPATYIADMIGAVKNA